MGELGNFLKENKEKLKFTKDKGDNVLELNLTVKNKEGVDYIYYKILKCFDNSLKFI